MTNEDKQALIGLCKIEIKRWKAASKSNPNMRYMVELMQLAHNTLATQPDEWQQRAEAAEAKLAELEKQEPAVTVFKKGDALNVCMIGADLPDGYSDLYAHAAPAINLAELVPDCFAELHKEIGERHYGRMPKEVQEAFDACAAILRNIEEQSQ